MEVYVLWPVSMCVVLELCITWDMRKAHEEMQEDQNVCKMDCDRGLIFWTDFR